MLKVTALIEGSIIGATPARTADFSLRVVAPGVDTAAPLPVQIYNKANPRHTCRELLKYLAGARKVFQELLWGSIPILHWQQSDVQCQSNTRTPPLHPPTFPPTRKSSKKGNDRVTTFFHFEWPGRRPLLCGSGGGGVRDCAVGPNPRKGCWGFCYLPRYRA